MIPSAMDVVVTGVATLALAFIQPALSSILKAAVQLVVLSVRVWAIRGPVRSSSSHQQLGKLMPRGNLSSSTAGGTIYHGHVLGAAKGLSLRPAVAWNDRTTIRSVPRSRRG